jgi:hypothetical protein
MSTTPPHPASIPWRCFVLTHWAGCLRPGTSSLSELSHRCPMLWFRDIRELFRRSHTEPFSDFSSCCPAHQLLRKLGVEYPAGTLLGGWRFVLGPKEAPGHSLPEENACSAGRLKAVTGVTLHIVEQAGRDRFRCTRVAAGSRPQDRDGARARQPAGEDWRSWADLRESYVSDTHRWDALACREPIAPLLCWTVGRNRRWLRAGVPESSRQ